MRTLTLMFFAAASLLLGAAAMPAALAAYQGGGSLPAGAYGSFAAAVATASALRHDGSADGPRTVAEAEAMLAPLDARDPNDRHRG